MTIRAQSMPAASKWTEELAFDNIVHTAVFFRLFICISYTFFFALISVIEQLYACV